MRRSWSTRSAVLTGACLLLALVGSYAATALVNAPDRSVPTLKVLSATGFRVGGQIEDNPSFPGAGYHNIPIRLAWSASDPSAICNYNVHSILTHAGAGAWPERDLYDDPGTAAFDGTLTDYDGSLGSGGGWPAGFTVGADDCAHNGLHTVGWAANPTVYQEDGTSFTRPTALTVTYAGSWRTGLCSCASGGKQKFTSTANASVSFTHNFGANSHVGLVMAEGPGRGKATVLVDGTAVRTVDTNQAGANVNRVVVFSRGLAAGSHTIKVVNQATAGHPRIDLDAILFGG